MTTDETFETRLVHGIVALVADREVDGGLRFALPGRDRLEDCVADAAALPEGEVTLRVFDARAAAGAYAEAIRKYAGNTASAMLGGKEDGTQGRVVLVLRHDRVRAVGGTVDEAVRLDLGKEGAYDREREAKRFRQARRDALESFKEEMSRQAGEAEWSAEVAAVRADERLRLPSFDRPSPGGPLAVELIEIDAAHPWHASAYDISRDGGRYRVDLGKPRSNLDGDLLRRLDDAATECGVDLREDRVSARLERVDSKALLAVHEAQQRFRRIEAELAQEGKSRQETAAFVADANACRAVARLTSGVLIVERRGYPGQMSPNSATHQRMSFALLERLCRGGWAELAWKGKAFNDRVRVYGPTEAAFLLAAGDVNAAARVRTPRDAHVRSDDLPVESLVSACESLSGRVADESRAKLASLSARALPPGGNISLKPNSSTYFDVLNLLDGILAGLVAGTLAMGPDGDVVAREEGGAPRP